MYALVSPDNSIIAYQSKNLVSVLHEKAKGYKSYIVKEMIDLKLIDYLKLYNKSNFKVLFLIKNSTALNQDILSLFNNVVTTVNSPLLESTLNCNQNYLFLNYITNVNLNRSNENQGTVDTRLEYMADLVFTIDADEAVVIKCRYTGCLNTVVKL
mgnify:CR=1 FL=1